MPHVFGLKRTNIHQLPVEFHTNKKAWMTNNLFRTWLYKQDRIFTREKRKVALIQMKSQSKLQGGSLPKVRLKNVSTVIN